LNNGSVDGHYFGKYSETLKAIRQIRFASKTVSHKKLFRLSNILHKITPSQLHSLIANSWSKMLRIRSA
jgi:hypothetical protein